MATVFLPVKNNRYMLRKVLAVFFGCWMVYSNLAAQDLEPRALTNIPIGTNVVLAGYGFAQGNILVDPTIPIVGLKANINSVFVAYARAINLFGLSGKINAVLPYAFGDWAGQYIGVDTTTSRNGFADLSVQLSFNFLGAPATERADFAAYKPNVVSGFSLRVVMPTGQYFDDKIINLGSNRWSFKSQWGISKHFRHWIFEGYAAARLFTKNSNFFGGKQVKQDPLYTFKVHLIRSLPKRMWFAIDLGYGLGGRTIINDVQQETRVSTMRYGLHYSLPVALHHSLKFSFISGVIFDSGGDFDAFVLTYQYIWNRRPIKQ